MSKCQPLAGINLTQERQFQVKVCIRKIWWLPIFFERFITPCYKVEVTNEGEDIPEGTAECDIVEHDDPPSYLAIKKEFINFQNFQLKNFKSGITLKFNCKLDSNFIKPSRYVLRVLIIRFEPDESSVYDEMVRTMKEYKNKKLFIKTTEGDKEATLEEFAKIYPEVKELRKGFARGIQIGDYRWNKIIVIHSLSLLLGILGTVLALIRLLIV